MNKQLAPDIELVCLMTSLQYQFVSASLLKEVAALGGDIDGLVPKHVAEALRQKLSAKA
jgi:pantetheine-phosphate adenylyltransferase